MGEDRSQSFIPAWFVIMPVNPVSVLLSPALAEQVIQPVGEKYKYLKKMKTLGSISTIQIDNARATFAKHGDSEQRA